MFIGRMGSHALAGVESACSKAIASASRQLPTHIRQEKPVWRVTGSEGSDVLNNNCILTSMKNLFYLFGWEREVPYLKSAIISMHEGIARHKGKALDTSSVLEALKFLPEQRKKELMRAIGDGKLEGTFISQVPLTVFQEIFANDAKALLKHGYTQHNVSELLKNVQHLPIEIRRKVGEAAQQQSVTEEFIQGILLQVKSAEKKLTSQSISRNSATTFMAQLGMKPEELPLGMPMAKQRVLKALLEEGKPICLAEKNLPTLTTMVDGTQKKVIGHYYMVFKKEGKLYISEPGKNSLIELPERVLLEKMEDPNLLNNSSAIIIHHPPDPLRWMRIKHP